MSETQTCPRRMQEMGPWKRKEELDSWIADESPEGRVGPYCSFCGSLHPEEFLKLITEGWLVEPANKNYKAYLSRVRSVKERTREQGVPMPAVTREGKFYYSHFSEEQMRRFVDLYNDDTMRIGRPGYFPVLPFFMAIGKG